MRLDDNKTYTLTLPEKCLNGNRMGAVLENYDIIEQKHFLVMLKEYLHHQAQVNLDDELNRFKFRNY